MIIRESDMFLGNEDLEMLYTIHRFPVYCGVADHSAEKDIFADMKWMISKTSGMVQLGELLPLDVLYSVSHNVSIGSKWKMHHQEFAKFLHKYVGKKGVLEIGGGNGILNSTYNRLFGGDDILWTIIEPSKVARDEGCSAVYIKKYWDDQLELDKVEYDTLVHSHLMEHQYDLQQFMRLNASVLKTGQRMVFSLPDLKFWVRKKYSNALFFEHTYLISDDYVEEVLRKYGFRILEKKSFGNGHSLFYAAEKTDEERINAKELDYKQLYTSNKSDFMAYVSYFEEKTREYNQAIDSAQGNVYLFGAHIFSQMLLNFGLQEKKIRRILDNDTLKQGKRLYGTSLLTVSPEEIKGEEKPLVILNAGAYSEEIKQDILQHVNHKAVIVE